MDVQGLMDVINESSRETRGNYHLTLGELVAFLDRTEVDDNTPVIFDNQMHPGAEDSYRGYYSDLAFAPVYSLVTFAVFRDQCKHALDCSYEGYKGGTFKMDRLTPLWCADHGDSTGLAIMGVALDRGFIVLSTKLIDS